MTTKSTTTPTAGTLNVPSENISLRLAAAYTDVPEQRLRKAAIAGIIEANKIDGKWTFSRESLDQFIVNKGANGHPRGSAKAYVVRLSPEQVAQLRDLGIEAEPRYKGNAAKTTAAPESKVDEIVQPA